MVYNKSVAIYTLFSNISKNKDIFENHDSKGGIGMTAEERRLLESTPRMYFDTRIGIQMMFQKNPETALKEVSILRKLYEEAHPGAKELHGFVVFDVNGDYLLTRHGETHKIIERIPNKEECLRYGVCLIVEDFLEITQIGSYHTEDVIFS